MGGEISRRAFLTASGVRAELIRKVHEGRPNIVDAMMNGEIQLVVNTPAGRLSQYDDSYIRKSAIKYKIPYITTITAAVAAAEGIAAFRAGRSGGRRRASIRFWSCRTSSAATPSPTSGHRLAAGGG